MFHEIPFELRMQVEGREFRKSVLELELSYPVYLHTRRCYWNK